LKILQIIYKIKAKVMGRKACSTSDHEMGIAINEGSRENAK